MTNEFNKKNVLKLALDMHKLLSVAEKPYSVGEITAVFSIVMGAIIREAKKQHADCDEETMRVECVKFFDLMLSDHVKTLSGENA